MRTGPTTLVFLVLATVGLDLALYAIYEGGVTHRPPILLVSPGTFIFAQVGLLSTWAVLDPGFWLWRVVVLAAGLCACGWLVASAIGGAVDTIRGHFVQTGFFAIQSGIVAVGSGWLRLAGFRWMDVTGGPETYLHSAKRQPFQFSLKDILSLVVIIAVASLGARNSVFDDEWINVLWVGNSILVLLAIWATFPSRWRPNRLVVYAIATIALGIAATLSRDTGNRFHIVVMIFMVRFFGLQALFLLAWLGACQLAGYRIVRVYQRSEA